MVNLRNHFDTSCTSYQYSVIENHPGSILQWNLPKYTPGNANETFRTKLSRETPGVIEVLEDERCEVHEILVGVVEPRS